MKKRAFYIVRRFFRRFNPWLFLVCVILAVIIFCATMYTEDPYGLREAAASVSSSLGDLTV